MKKKKTGIHCNYEFIVKTLVNLYQERGSVPGTMWTKTPSDELILISRTSTQTAPGLTWEQILQSVSKWYHTL